MNIHEFQGKALFAEFGLPIPVGEAAQSVEDALAIYEKFSSKAVVVKAQVHAGGRGKAGGVKLVEHKEELVAAVKSMLGTNLVTYQTDERGQPVRQVLIEETCDIDRELYVGAVIDRSERRLVIMVSTEGGVEIEKVASESPEKILKITVDPLLGVLPFQVRNISAKLDLTAGQVKQFTQLLINLNNIFMHNDLSLIEINPLVITKQGNLLCLDAKVNIDDNALYRQPKLRALRDTTQEDERENRAHDWELNYIALDGNIGCMVNGAGLAMATMDLVKLHGGNPANFLDVGGGATKERVAEAFKIILSDSNVKAVLVNIFGGIVRCDLIADGIIDAIAEVDVKVPVIVRLEGNNAELGAEKLANSGLNIIAANGLTEAAQAVVKSVEA
ncbi:MAG: ADP-forming succinate--CoA ligase subunit beta [Gammaproteobacteria bacterium]